MHSTLCYYRLSTKRLKELMDMSPYEKIFSANIRKYRKQLGFTQKMLADATGYSEKTVSKWETDGCIPQIDSLIRIASVFRINLDTLFQEKEPMYFLGIDGGGTKTAFALADPAHASAGAVQSVRYRYRKFKKRFKQWNCSNM